MTDQPATEFEACSKKVWIMYTIIAICLTAYMGGVVAQDTEELFFYTMMTAAVSYVFRPTDKFIAKMVMRIFKVAPPVIAEESKAEENKTEDS